MCGLPKLLLPVSKTAAIDTLIIVGFYKVILSG